MSGTERCFLSLKCKSNDTAEQRTILHDWQDDWKIVLPIFVYFYNWKIVEHFWRVLMTALSIKNVNKRSVMRDISNQHLCK